MIKAIIFDFFDVIRTDSYKAWLAANNIPHEGPYFDASYQQDMGNINTGEFLQRLSDLQGRPITQKEIDATAKVDQAVLAIVQSLTKNYKLALLSNAPSVFLRDILAKHRLEQHFNEIVISSEVGMVKPQADIFKHTLQKLGTKADETIFIDDNEKHVTAADKLGIRTIHFHAAEQLKNELLQHDITI